MISEKEAWIYISACADNEGIGKHIANFLEEQNAKSIMSLFSGPGHILPEIANRGIKISAITTSEIYSTYSSKHNKHRLIDYNFVPLSAITKNFTSEKYDAVLIRENSLANECTLEGLANTSTKLDGNKIKKKMMAIMETAYSFLNNGGWLYIDTISPEYILHLEQKKGAYTIKKPEKNVDIKGTVIFDAERKQRHILEQGIVNGQAYRGNNMSYLLSIEELEEMANQLKPKEFLIRDLKKTPYRGLWIRK
ncbi:MAG: hypothetical protein ACP5N3_06310 [Candidatus Nanoarchaeia archaeon]